ncbi:MAG: hypothetical protein N2376_00430 [Clostridia bacterium]|nr:hypothetical protein [Clostridia bacterium]
MAVQEDVNLKVLELFEQVGIPLTLPAQRLVLENGSELKVPQG